MAMDSNELYDQTSKMKSAKAYFKAWEMFVEFHDGKENGFIEDDFGRFFKFMGEVREYSPSTIWKVYSMLNHMFQMKFNEGLKQWPKLTKLVQSYEAGYVRKCANTFEPDQVYDFLDRTDLDSPYWLVRKAIVAIAVAGGHRCIEIRDLQMENVTYCSKDDCYIVVFNRAKQCHKEMKKSCYMIPFSKSGRNWGSYVKKYLDRLARDLPKEDLTHGDFFRKSTWTKVDCLQKRTNWQKQNCSCGSRSSQMLGTGKTRALYRALFQVTVIFKKVFNLILVC